MSEENQILLPYNLDIRLLEDIIDDLKTGKTEGVKIGTLWINVSAAKNFNRSYTLNAGKFLGLLDTDRTNVWLTDFGRKCFQYTSGDKRRTLLAQNMPQTYLAIFKWIKKSGELTTSEVKGKFIENYGSRSMSTIVLTKVVNSFLNYFHYLKIIRYSGKGAAAKGTVTDFGANLFDSVYEDEITGSSKSEKLNPIPPKQSISELPKGSYPIKIKTLDREFNYDIRTENDLKVIDTVITSIKDDWQVSQKKQPSDKEGDDK